GEVGFEHGRDVRGGMQQAVHHVLRYPLAHRGVGYSTDLSTNLDRRLSWWRRPRQAAPPGLGTPYTLSWRLVCHARRAHVLQHILDGDATSLPGAAHRFGLEPVLGKQPTHRRTERSGLAARLHRSHTNIRRCRSPLARGRYRDSGGDWGVHRVGFGGACRSGLPRPDRIDAAEQLAGRDLLLLLLENLPQRPG